MGIKYKFDAAKVTYQQRVATPTPSPHEHEKEDEDRMKTDHVEGHENKSPVDACLQPSSTHNRTPSHPTEMIIHPQRFSKTKQEVKQTQLLYASVSCPASPQLSVSNVIPRSTSKHIPKIDLRSIRAKHGRVKCKFFPASTCVTRSQVFDSRSALD
jgi:hypothetical protein